MSRDYKEENKLLVKLFYAKGEDFIVENGAPLKYGRSGWYDYDYKELDSDEKERYLKIARIWEKEGKL